MWNLNLYLTISTPAEQQTKVKRENRLQKWTTYRNDETMQSMEQNADHKIQQKWSDNRASY